MGRRRVTNARWKWVPDCNTRAMPSGCIAVWRSLNVLTVSVTDQQFKDSSLLQKMFFILVATSLVRPKYYIAWKLSMTWLFNVLVECKFFCWQLKSTTWLMISVSSPRTQHTTALETEALVLSAHEFGTVCHVACEHLTSATNILKHFLWRHVSTRPRRFVTFI